MRVISQGGPRRRKRITYICEARHTGQKKIFTDDKGRRICGARTQKGTPCHSRNLGQGGRCKWHGGASHPPGPAHPNWKHGRGSAFTKDLPHHLRDAFIRTVNDPEFVSVKLEMGLMDARLVELIQQLTTGESAQVLVELQGRLDDISNELRQDEPEFEHVHEVIEEMRTMLRSRSRDQATWSDIRETIESRRRLTDTERRLIEFQKGTVDVVQLRAIVTFLLQAVREHVLPLEGGDRAVQGVAVEVRKLLMPNERPHEA